MNTDKLKAWIEENTDDWAWLKGTINAERFLSFLSEQDDWIDVNERLPESAGRYFVLRNNPVPYIVRFGTNGKWVMDNETITCWLPLSALPTPPITANEE